MTTTLERLWGVFRARVLAERGNLCHVEMEAAFYAGARAALDQVTDERSLARLRDEARLGLVEVRSRLAIETARGNS